jgi:septal ring factor EnvC (AmiA/AmiB activator)
MNRFFSIFNCLGVGVLAVLCAVQWQANSRLENNVEQLDKTRIEQSAKIAEQERTLKDDAADLEDLRQRLSMSESELKKAVAEAGRLKTALDKWKAALKQAGEQIQKLAGERNEAIQKFNDLADKYNALVKQTGGESK